MSVKGTCETTGCVLEEGHDSQHSGDRSLLRAPTDELAQSWRDQAALSEKQRDTLFGNVAGQHEYRALTREATIYRVCAADLERAVDGLRGADEPRRPFDRGMNILCQTREQYDACLEALRRVETRGAGVGTEDRALREQLEALAEAAQNYLLAEQHVGVSAEQMRALHHRLGSLAGPHLKAKCARESVEGEERAGGSHGGD